MIASNVQAEGRRHTVHGHRFKWGLTWWFHIQSCLTQVSSVKGPTQPHWSRITSWALCHLNWSSSSKTTRRMSSSQSENSSVSVSNQHDNHLSSINASVDAIASVETINDKLIIYWLINWMIDWRIYWLIEWLLRLFDGWRAVPRRCLQPSDWHAAYRPDQLQLWRAEDLNRASEHNQAIAREIQRQRQLFMGRQSRRVEKAPELIRYRLILISIYQAYFSFRRDEI